MEGRGQKHGWTAPVSVSAGVHVSLPGPTLACVCMCMWQCDGSRWLIRRLRRPQIALTDCFWEPRLIYNQGRDEGLSYGLLICLVPPSSLPPSPQHKLTNYHVEHIRTGAHVKERRADGNEGDDAITQTPPFIKRTRPRINVIFSRCCSHIFRVAS